MDKTELIIRLRAVFGSVFDDVSIVIDNNTTADDIEDWDSLSHITLISEVETEFRIKFSMSEVLGMKNVGEMIDIISAKTKH